MKAFRLRFVANFESVAAVQRALADGGAKIAGILVGGKRG
jgi:hypothetical protein